jgi:hypothetical protein
MTENAERPAPTTPTEDELVSTVLDGEASDAEHTVVTSDPRLSARLASFERVRDALPVDPPPAAARATTIRTALERAASTPASDTSARLDLARERRRHAIATAVAIAAAALIVVPLLALTLTSRGTESSDTAATGAAVGAASEDTSELESVGRAVAGGGVDAGDLGVLMSTSELRATVRQALTGTTESFSGAPSSTTTPAAPGVDDQRQAGPAASTSSVACTPAAATAASASTAGPELTATATWAGEPVFVYVFRIPPPTDSATASDAPVDVIVVTRLDCSIVERTPA